jgi:hypothetical protein
MTDLRFGTETGQSPRVSFHNLTSVRGESSQRVTPVNPLKRAVLARLFFCKAVPGSPRVARGFSGTGRGCKPHGGWSQSSEWLPGWVGSTPCSAAEPRANPFSDGAVRGRASARGEGASPTAELVDLGGAKGQESIGSNARLTARLEYGRSVGAKL